MVLLPGSKGLGVFPGRSCPGISRAGASETGVAFRAAPPSSGASALGAEAPVRWRRIVVIVPVASRPVR